MIFTPSEKVTLILSLNEPYFCSMTMFILRLIDFYTVQICLTAWKTLFFEVNQGTGPPG